MKLRREGAENPKFYKYQFFKILRKSCEIVGADYAKALTRTRKQESVNARFYAYAVFYNRYNSYVSIEKMGEYIGRNHSTVLHMKKNVNNWIETNFSCRRIYIELEEWTENNTELSAPIVTKKEVQELDSKIEEFKTLIDKQYVGLFNEILEEKERRVFAIIK